MHGRLTGKKITWTRQHLPHFAVESAARQARQRHLLQWLFPLGLGWVMGYVLEDMLHRSSTALKRDSAYLRAPACSHGS